MKKLIAFIIIISTLAIVSCGKKPDDSVEPKPTKFYSSETYHAAINMPSRVLLVQSGGLYYYSKVDGGSYRFCFSGTTLTSSSAYTYYPTGNVATETTNTGKVTTYLYDDLGRLVSEAVTGTSNNSTITYTYDNRGNRLTQTRDGITVSYTYDLNNRLTTSTANGVTGYTYDANGNTLSVVGTSGSSTLNHNHQTILKIIYYTQLDKNPMR